VTSKEELQWVLRAQCGDRDALETLLRSTQMRLRQYLCGLVGAQQTDDVLQDALIVICQDVRGLRVPELFWAWAFRIASRLAFRHLQQERNRHEETLDSGSIEQLLAIAPKPPELVLENLLQSTAIPPASKAVFALHFGQELSLAEVAVALDIPMGTVKSRLVAGLSALRRRFSKEGVPNA
jgi:RNA polymerase sigma factor (sigma-70 family)